MQAARLQTVSHPDALHRAQADTNGFRHCPPGQRVATPGGSAQVAASNRATSPSGSGGVPVRRVLSRRTPSTPASA